MLTPCKFIGSVRYVHDLCYRKWVETLFSTKDRKEQGIMVEHGVECKMCKERVKMNLTQTINCVTC